MNELNGYKQIQTFQYFSPPSISVLQVHRFPDYTGNKTKQGDTAFQNTLIKQCR